MPDIITYRRVLITPPLDNEFITGSIPGSLRSDYSDWVGFGFTVAGLPITITHLGRWIVAGNTGTHNLKITTDAGVTVVSSSISTSGLQPGGFSFVPIAHTVINALTVYYMFSEELSGGDQWYNKGPVTWTAAGTDVIAAYMAGGVGVEEPTWAHGPTNFKYK